MLNLNALYLVLWVVGPFDHTTEYRIPTKTAQTCEHDGVVKTYQVLGAGAWDAYFVCETGAEIMMRLARKEKS